MNKLFVHQPVFRLLSPIFIGVLVYLFILLVNNNVEQLQEAFLGEELYLCVGLSFLILEFSRFSIILFDRISWPISTWGRLLLQIGVSIAICVFLVTTTIFLYYQFVVGFVPNPTELIIFNSIFSSFTLIYIALYLSHQYLYKTNQEKLAEEQGIKQGLEEDFKQFEKGINPTLFFESLEALIILVHEDPDEAEELIDHLAVIYRHLLSARKKELIPFQEEVRALEELCQLFNHLPYRKVALNIIEMPKTWIIPGAILFLIELIIRSTISSVKTNLDISISEKEEALILEYQSHDRINKQLTASDLIDLSKSYTLYSNDPISMSTKGLVKTIQLPALLAIHSED